MKAQPLHREKRLVLNSSTSEIAIAELKVWKIPKSEHYKMGRKFSLFLMMHGRVLIGIDNHQPKGPHLHLGNEEVNYNYKNDDQLLKDFWDLVRKAGFEP